MDVDKQIQEQAEKLYPVNPVNVSETLTIDSNKLGRDGFLACAQWMQEREKTEIEELIDYIENDAEIAIPIEDLMGENGNGLTKKEYGLVLLKHLVIELRSKFPNPKENA